MAEKKEKQYVSDNARLMSEWDWEKNNAIGLAPTILTLGMARKAWWKCNEGHEWEAIVVNRVKGSGCPYCSGRKVLKGFNDLLTVNPILASEWNHEKNGNTRPEEFTANSGQKVWWKCSNGHEWEATIASRNSGRDCPYCAGHKTIIGQNDLLTLSPKLASEWDYEINGELTPSNVMPNSNKKVWWRCSEGHRWQAVIAHRNRGSGCPYCAGQKVLLGQNDLESINPTLANEWNYGKNNGLTPAEVTANSHKKVWWKCSKGHEWQATIANRNKGSGCHVCISEQHTSFPEYAIVYYLKKYGVESIHSHKSYGYELDIYIPSKKIAIEYDGFYWHKDKIQQDLNKNRKCQKDGIKLFRMREGLPSLNDTSIDYLVEDNQKNLSIILAKMLSEITEVDVDVNLTRDIADIDVLREYTEKENSILISSPLIAQEWNYSKNKHLKPENFTAGSGKCVWWICKHGYEWKAPIYSRKNGNGCPYCSGHNILVGENDLLTVNPSLASEWNYEKNNGLMPTEVMAGSDKKVWWKCNKGHEWQATIYNRSNGRGCPECAKQKRKKKDT